MCFAGFLGLFLVACAQPRPRLDLPPAELYRLAEQAVEDHEFEHAETLIDQIRDEFPFSKYVMEAEILAADVAYEKETYEEAAAAYRSFEELHPTHPKVPYAIFRRGMSYLEISLPPDRDQTATRNAVEAFQKLLYAHPKSDYAVSARESLTEARGHLAGHELYVARYYNRKKKYDAALHRLQGLVQTYADTPHRDEALRLALAIQTKKRETEDED
jgi:outer membrane protein assembly factor BamD